MLLQSEKSEKIAVLVPYETDAPKLEVKKYIDALIAGGIDVYFKSRKDINPEVQLAEYGIHAAIPENMKAGAVYVYSDHERIIGKISAVLGTILTFLYDMISYEKPVAIMRTSLDYGEGMAANGLAFEISSPANAVSEVRNISETPPAELRRRVEFLFGDNPIRLGDTVQKLLSDFNL